MGLFGYQSFQGKKMIKIIEAKHILASVVSANIFDIEKNIEEYR